MQMQKQHKHLFHTWIEGINNNKTKQKRRKKTQKQWELDSRHVEGCIFGPKIGEFFNNQEKTGLDIFKTDLCTF